MSTIPLHPERGIDPHFEACVTCGEDTGALVLGHTLVLLDADGKICGYKSRGRPLAKAASQAVSQRELEERERVYTGTCDKCAERQDLSRKMVEEGGIYLKCEECRFYGALKKTPLADKVREDMATPAPDLCGLNFTCCKDHIDLGIDSSKVQS